MPQRGGKAAGRVAGHHHPDRQPHDGGARPVRESAAPKCAPAGGHMLGGLAAHHGARRSCVRPRRHARSRHPAHVCRHEDELAAGIPVRLDLVSIHPFCLYLLLLCVWSSMLLCCSGTCEVGVV